MYSTYTSSVLWSIRSKGYNDYSYLLPERSERYTFGLSSPCSRWCCASSRPCCSCCSEPSSSLVKHKVSISPRFVIYGLRQSTLIQWPPFRRRLLVGRGDWLFDRFLGCEVDGECCEVSSSGRERYCSYRSNGARRNRGFRHRAYEESGECRDLGGLDEAEAMIALLSEECSCGKARNRSSVRRVEEKRRVKYGDECHGGSVRRIEIGERTNYGNGRSIWKNKEEEGDRRNRFDREQYRGNERTEEVKIREIYDIERYAGKKRNSALGNDLQPVYKSNVLESGGETSRKNEEREARLRRTKSSSCSSYYSLSSSGEFESDIEDNQDGNQEKSEKRLVEVLNNELESCKKAFQIHSRRRTNQTDYGVGSNYHKQVYEEEENSDQGVALERRRRKQHSHTVNHASDSRRNHEEDTEIHEIHVNDVKMNSQNQKGFSLREDNTAVSVRSDVDQSDYGVGSNYHKQVYEEEENSDQGLALEIRRRRRHSQTVDHASHSRRNHEDDTEMHEIHVNDMKINSQNQKRFSLREGHTAVSVRSDVDGANKQNSSKQLYERSGIRSAGKERVSQMPRRSKHSNIQEEDANVARNSLQKTKGQWRQAEESMFRQAGLRGTTESFSEKSRIHDTDIRNTYLSHTENQERSREEYPSWVSGSRSDVKEQHYYTDRAPLQKIHSGKNSVSASHSGDVIRIKESQRTSEKRIIGEESTHTSVVQLGGETRESRARKDRVEQTNPRKEDQKAYGLLRSQEKVFEAASSSPLPLSSGSRNRIQQVNPDREDIRDSETILVPPSSQLVSRGSGHGYRTGGVLIQDVSYETSSPSYDAADAYPETGSSINSQSPGELLSLTTHEDTLGSAHRSLQASAQIIGEFVEKAKDEASISEIQKERAENYQLRRRDSRQSSGVSGTKGPSDEMWVTEPSAQGTPQPGELEGSASGEHAIVKRSGRSLWSIIADIARLRWGLRAGTPDTVAKPAGKGSPNESGSSATWFSGREHDRSSDDNAKGDKGVSSQDFASPRQPELGQISSVGQFESSGSMNLRQQSGQHEVEISSSSGRLEGGSASRHLCSASGDQSVGLEEVRSSQSRLPELDAVEMPLLLPARSLRQSPAIKEPSEPSSTGVSGDRNVGLYGEGSFQSQLPETDAVQMPLLQPHECLRNPPGNEPSESRSTAVSGSISLGEQVEQQPGARSHEETASLASDSVLKQRKLHRNKQVTRDRFDEWEEAYKLEADRRKVDEMFMREAILEAKKAADLWEVPVGAVLVHDGKIIARGRNLVEELRDSTAHAEMVCIREGSKVLHSWRLAETTLYVTLEPCPMCAGAILQARVNTLVWGAPNKLLGADGSWIRLLPGGEGNGSETSDKPPAPVHPFHPKMAVRRGVLEPECAEAMQQFFKLRRKKKDKTDVKSPEPPTPPSCLPVSHHHPSKLLDKMHHFFHFINCL